MTRMLAWHQFCRWGGEDKVFCLETRSNNNNNNNSDSSMEKSCDLGMVTARWKQARKTRTLKRRQQNNNNQYPIILVLHRWEF